jgi:hypothetical protein
MTLYLIIAIPLILGVAAGISARVTGPKPSKHSH